MSVFKTKLEAALGARLALVFLVAMVLLTSLAVFLMWKFGSYSIKTNEANIRHHMNDYLLTAVTEEAKKYSVVFEQTSIFVDDLATMAQFFLEKLPIYGKENINPDEKLIYYPKQKMYSNVETADVMVLFGYPYQKANMTPHTQKELNALSHLDRWLINFKGNSSYYLSAFVETESGIMRYYPNIHIIEQLPPDYSVQKEKYYWIAAPKNNPNKQPCWTNIYKDVTGMEMVSVSAPLYLKNEFYGVAGMDIDMKKFLDMIATQRSQDELDNSFSILVQKNGGIAAIWREKLEILGLETENVKDLTYYQDLPYALGKSKIPDVIKLQSLINENDEGTIGVTLTNGRRYLCAFSKIPANGWTLLTFATENDLFSSIAKTRRQLHRVTWEMIAYFAISIILIVFGAYWMITKFLTKRIHLPIQALEKEMRNVGKSQTKSALRSLYPDEIGRLTNHFNEMSENINNYRNNMEQLVHERTRELEKANNQLETAKATAEKASKSKSMFISKMSHELRTPLNAILGYAQILEGAVQDDTLRNQAAAIGFSGHHLLDLINNILDLAKMEAGKMPLTPEPTEIRILINEVKYIFNNQMDEKKLAFFIEIDDSVPDVIIVDPPRFRQVLINIIGNAVKYTERGHVKLKLDAMKKSDSAIDLTLRVTDTGKGMTKEFLENLFTPFVQENNKNEGAGLGLTISKHIVESMNGTISVDSILSQGTCFTIQLPSISYKKNEESPAADNDAASLSSIQDVNIEFDEEKLRPLLEQWDKVRESSVFEDIAGFAQNVLDYAEQNDVASLRLWAKNIIDMSKTFNLRKLKSDLRKFEELIKNG